MLAVAGLAVLLSDNGAQGGKEPLKGLARPNIVFVYTDDQNVDDFRPQVMPRTWRRLVKSGTRFTDFVVASPLCCPSRVSFLTGQYPHNSGAFDNGSAYPAMRQKSSTLATWLRGEGYRTAWIGKFIQGYEKAHSIGTPAPGWDEWAVTVEPRYYEYDLGRDGEISREGSGAGNYHTTVMTDSARRFVDRSARRGPFFIVVNYLAPHSGNGGAGRCAGTAQPAPKDLGRFRRAALPSGPAFNEANVRDKPRSLQRPPLGRRARLEIVRRYRCRLESLAAVDRGVGAIYRAVRRSGELDRTIFILTSDNGLLLGEHRRRGKHWGYEEGIRMPLAMRVPERYVSGSPAERVDELVSNIDLAPTILDLAGGVRPCARGTCRALDGRSFAELLGGRSAWPEDRGVLIESGRGNCKEVRAIRTPGDVYMENNHGSGTCDIRQEPEHYDLRRDPFQLENLVGTDDALGRRAELRRRLSGLQRCSARSCE